MNNFKITLNQKRFLIIWICVHSFALFVNLVGLEGGSEYRGSEQNGLFHTFTTKDYQKEDFWPFTTFLETHEYYTTNYDDPRNTIGITFRTRNEAKQPDFNGIFNSYNLPEYIFYVLLGLGIVFIPKAWN